MRPLLPVFITEDSSDSDHESVINNFFRTRSKPKATPLAKNPSCVAPEKSSKEIMATCYEFVDPQSASARSMIHRHTANYSSARRWAEKMRLRSYDRQKRILKWRREEGPGSTTSPEARSAADSSQSSPLDQSLIGVKHQEQICGNTDPWSPPLLQHQDSGSSTGESHSSGALAATEEALVHSCRFVKFPMCIHSMSSGVSQRWKEGEANFIRCTGCVSVSPNRTAIRGDHFVHSHGQHLHAAFVGLLPCLSRHSFG